MGTLKDPRFQVLREHGKIQTPEILESRGRETSEREKRGEYKLEHGGYNNLNSKVLLGSNDLNTILASDRILNIFI